jgi:hypothetical protein
MRPGPHYNKRLPLSNHLAGVKQLSQNVPIVQQRFRHASQCCRSIGVSAELGDDGVDLGATLFASRVPGRTQRPWQLSTTSRDTSTLFRPRRQRRGKNAPWEARGCVFGRWGSLRAEKRTGEPTRERAEAFLAHHSAAASAKGKFDAGSRLVRQVALLVFPSPTLQHLDQYAAVPIEAMWRRRSHRARVDAQQGPRATVD